MMKQLKWSVIVMAIAFIVLGVVVIIYPGQTMKTMAYLLAGCLIVLGIVNLVQYVKMDAMLVIDKYDLAIGFSAIIGGILIFINLDKFLPMITTVLGFMITISGVMKLQNSINLMRLKSDKWPIPFFMAIINIVYGVVMLIDPFSEALLAILLGIGFILSGITDLIVTIMVSSTLAKVVKDVMGDTQVSAPTDTGAAGQ